VYLKSRPWLPKVNKPVRKNVCKEIAVYRSFQRTVVLLRLRYGRQLTLLTASHVTSNRCLFARRERLLQFTRLPSIRSRCSNGSDRSHRRPTPNRSIVSARLRHRYSWDLHESVSQTAFRSVHPFLLNSPFISTSRIPRFALLHCFFQWPAAVCPFPWTDLDLHPILERVHISNMF